MKSDICKCLLFSIFLFSSFLYPQKKEIIAYFPEWGIEREYYVKNLETSGSADKLTVINYAFAVPKPDSSGKITAHIINPYYAYQQIYTSEMSIDGVADDSAQILKGQFNQLKKLKARHPGLKVVISFGGWGGSTYFSDAALTPVSREIFVNSCIDLFIQGNLPADSSNDGKGAAAGVFDGIDIDWEYPVSGGAEGIHHNENDKDNLSELFALFRTKLDSINPALILSAAVPGGGTKFNFYNDQKYLNWYLLMTYDFAGAWDPRSGHHTNLLSSNQNFLTTGVEPSLDNTVRLFVNTFGVSKDKIIPGAAFYGRGWKLKSTLNNGLYQEGEAAQGVHSKGSNFYRDIVPLISKDYEYRWDSKSLAPYLYSQTDTIFWTFDDVQSLALKSRYVDAYGLRGIMFWEISGDDSSGTLINTIFTRNMPDVKTDELNNTENILSFKIINPQPDDLLLEGSKIIIDTDILTTSPIIKVEFFVDEVSIGYDSMAPFNWAWFKITPGKHKIRAAATAVNGNIIDSGVVEVSVEKSFNCMK